MDDGRAFPSGLSFLSLLSFFLPCSSLFHTRLVSTSSVFCPVVLPLPSSFPSFFFPYIQEFPGEIENIGTECDAILKIVSNGSEYGNRGFIHRLEKS